MSGYPPPSLNPHCQCQEQPLRALMCSTGHMMECHHPYACRDAGCSHLLRYDLPPGEIVDLCGRAEERLKAGALPPYRLDEQGRIVVEAAGLPAQDPAAVRALFDADAEQVRGLGGADQELLRRAWPHLRAAAEQYVPGQIGLVGEPLVRCRFAPRDAIATVLTPGLASSRFSTVLEALRVPAPADRLDLLILGDGLQLICLCLRPRGPQGGGEDV